MAGLPWYMHVAKSEDHGTRLTIRLHPLWCFWTAFRLALGARWIDEPDDENEVLC